MQDAGPIIESEPVHDSKPASRRRATNEDITSSRRVRSSLQRTRHTTRYPTSSTPLQAVTKYDSKRRSDSGHGKSYARSLLPSLVESTECGPVVSASSSPESIGSGPPPGFVTPKSVGQPVLSEFPQGAAELDPKLSTPERSKDGVPVVDGSVAMAECPLPLSTESLTVELADSGVSSNSSLIIDDSVMSGCSTPGGDSKLAEELNRGRKFSPPVGSNAVASEFPASRSGPSRAESDSNSFRESGSFNIPPPVVSSTGPSPDELNHRSPPVTLNPSLPVGESIAEYKPPRDSRSRSSQAERDLKPNARYSIGVPPSSFRVGPSNHHHPSVPSAPTVRISPPLSKAIRVVRSECPRPISFPTPIISSSSSSSSRTLPPLTRSESYPTQLEPYVPSSPRPTHSPPSRQCIVDLSDLLQEFDEKLRTTRQTIRSEQQRSASRTLLDATVRSDLQSEWENQRLSKSITADWLYEHALKCLELETKQDPIIGSEEFYGTESMGLDDSQQRNDRSDREPNGTSPPEIDGNETRKGFGCARVMRTGFWKSVLPCVR